MRYRIKVEVESEDGCIQSTELAELEVGDRRSAADVGLRLASAKEIVARLQRAGGESATPQAL